MGENENRKWHCPEGDKLWADLDTDAERIEFLESGQAINTGIIAPSMIAEIVSVFRRAETAEADLAKRTCEWEEYGGMWRPGCCGETWEFTDDGPRKNAVTHCMFCGGSMIFATGKDGE